MCLRASSYLEVILCFAKFEEENKESLAEDPQSSRQARVQALGAFSLTLTPELVGRPSPAEVLQWTPSRPSQLNFSGGQSAVSPAGVCSEASEAQGSASRPSLCTTPVRRPMRRRAQPAGLPCATLLFPTACKAQHLA